MSEELRVDARVATEYLRSLYPDQPWFLVSFVPDGAPKTARMMIGRDDDQTREWIARMNAGAEHRNLYYQVNPLRPDADKARASLTTIAAVHHFHVDIDPRLNESKEEFLERVLPLLEKPPVGIPRPTKAVLSGSGVNALWTLEVPIALDGSEAAAREACRYNYALELAFGADSCHDVARVLRLPGTINWPNAGKRKKGRVPTMSSVLWSDDVKYPLAAFRQGPSPGSGADTDIRGAGNSRGAGERRAAEPPANVAYLGDVDKVMKLIRHPEGIGDLDKIARIIQHGRDPQDPEHYKSGSEPMWFVACALVRGGVSDDDLFAVLTDPALGVSEHVRRQGSPAKYAMRQIERAKTFAEHPWLLEMNDRYTVIGSLGGECKVVEEVPHAVIPNRYTLDIVSFESINKLYGNRKVQGSKTDKHGNPVLEKMGHAWLEHPRRATRNRIVFAPNKDTPFDYNLWRGFAYVPRVGDRHQGFLDHVRDNVCGGRADLYDYVVKWMAMAVQYPDRPGHVAIVLRGPPGTGKGTLAKVFGKLWGRHFVHVQHHEHLVGKFNGHLREAVTVFADECFWAGDKRHEGTLKTMITEETLPIEDKYARVDAGAPNFVHLIIASNENWVVPVGVGDRRFCVIDVGTERMQDTKYFREIVEKQLEADDGLGFSHLLHHLQNLDLTGFEPRTIPETAARKEQKLLSLSVEQAWWLRKLEDGQILPGLEKWSDPVVTRVLYDDYALTAQKAGTPRKSMEIALGIFLQKMCPAGLRKKRGMIKVPTPGPGGMPVMSTETAIHYLFPPLSECRKAWDTIHGAHVWPTMEDDGTVF